MKLSRLLKEKEKILNQLNEIDNLIENYEDPYGGQKMKKINTKLNCIGCKTDNNITLSKMSSVQWKIIKFNCNLCESQSIIRLKRITGPKIEGNKTKFQIELLKFHPPKPLIGASLEVEQDEEIINEEGNNET